MGGLFHKLRHPRRCYVVCAIPRSGSNLLTDGLHATRRAGRPKQFFLRKSESDFAATHNLPLSAGFAAYVRDISAATATSNEVFGFKLMSWYLDDFLGRLRGTGAFGDAGTTDLKVQEGKTVQREPQFDAELIEQCLKESEEQEKLWGRFFQRIGIDPLRVEYENLCEDYEANIRRVLNFLQISLPRRIHIGSPVTVRQADEISRAWEERFLAERSASQSLVRT